MASFKALNALPDSDSEDEVDDTKELQIEEALKLYQNALRLHAQGPEYFSQALEAYAELFSSEIWSWPESQSDWEQAPPITTYDSDDEQVADADPTAFRIGGESAPSTLPQILFSSLKNNGQYMVDITRGKVEKQKATAIEQGLPQPSLDGVQKRSAQHALTRFFTALSHDETDSETWRRAARLAGALGSRRVERFCLESVLDQEQEGTDDHLENPGLEESFAADSLVELVRSYSDEASLSRSPLKELQHRKLASFLRKHKDPYPFYPKSIELARQTGVHQTALGPQPHEMAVEVPEFTWSATGAALLQSVADQASPGSAVRLRFLQRPDEPKHVNSQAEEELEQQPNVQAEGDTIMLEPPPQEQDSQPTQVDTSSVQHDKSTNSKETNDPEGEDEDSDSKIARASKSRSMSPRKRTSSSAGLTEGAEGGRIRSKRIKARGSKDESALSGDRPSVDAQRSDERQEMLTTADNLLFDYVGATLRKIGATALGPASTIRSIISDEDDEQALIEYDDNIIKVVIPDLKSLVLGYTDNMGRILLYGEGSDDSSDAQNAESSPKAGILAFLDHASGSKGRTISPEDVWSEQEGLSRFENELNDDHYHPRRAVIKWLLCLLDASYLDTLRGKSSYESHVWSEQLKDLVTRVLMDFDEDLYSILSEVDQCSTNQSAVRTKLVQTIFELNLDLLSLLIKPSSKSDQAACAMQKDRCERWAALTNDYIRKFSAEESSSQDLFIRFFWAMTFHMSLILNDSQEHVVLCIQDLKSLFEVSKTPEIILPNNDLMPELSVAAADREIAKITMKDLFLGLFRDDSEDTAETIMKLEVILNPSNSDTEDPQTYDANAENKEVQSPAVTSTKEVQLRQMAEFIRSGKASFKLFLYRRLREAYESISYPPMVLSCILRSIEVVIADLRSPQYAQYPPQHRKATLMKWLRTLDQLVIQALSTMLKDEKAMDCIDLDHCRSTIAAFIGLIKLLHSFTLLEDPIRLGHRKIPDIAPESNASTFLLLGITLRDMLIRCWTVLFVLFKDAMGQQKDVIPDPSADLVNFVRGLHYSCGLRAFCHGANKVFLKYAEFELLQLKQSDERDNELAQLFRDLYGLNFGGGSYTLSEHNCKPENLRMNTALRIMPFALHLIRKIPMKDLAKSDLRSVIDRMQTVIGAPKATNAMSYNVRIYSAYVKTQINPRDLFECLKGRGDISWVAVTAPSAFVARQDWYFLLGYSALVRFRSQKRTSASSTEDINVANTFFRIDLQHGMDKWETWYRQAQAYDTLVEEDVSWSAEKLNGNRKDIRENQKIAIHCYVRAVACAMRDARFETDDNEASREKDLKVSEMFTDFGMRMYSSATPPFSMEVFDLQNYLKPFSGAHGLYEKTIYPELTQFRAFGFAGALFRRALVDQPSSWMNHYMLGKCLWKMLNHSDNMKKGTSLVKVQQPLDCFIEAIKNIPEQRREKQEPILEPHYKLISVVHKLVQTKRLDPEEASEILQSSSYAQKIPKCTDLDSWDTYILSLLKALRTADKSNWHHRMIVRAAHVMYDSTSDSNVAATAAKNELTQQTFTKSMAVQVWRPEHERTGRHFVYTSEYVHFFTKLLGQLKAQSALEALARKVRRANGHFFQHDLVWTEVCTTYAHVMRSSVEAHCPAGSEASVFLPMQHATFLLHSPRVEAWCQNPANSHVLLDLLREIIELKRLNGVTSAGIKTYKGPAIDDLAADTYAKLYNILLPEILKTLSADQNRAVMSLGNLLSSSAAVASTDQQASAAPAGGDAPGPGSSSTMTLPTTTPTVPGTTTGSQQVAFRHRHVSRKDVLKSAEAAVSKVAPTTATTSSTPTSMPRVVVPSRRSASRGHGDPLSAGSGAVLPSPEDNGKEGKAAAGVAVMMTPNLSEQGIEDDDDDESELSAIDEDIIIVGEEGGADGERRDEEDEEKADEAGDEDDGEEEDEQQPVLMFPGLAAVEDEDEEDVGTEVEGEEGVGEENEGEGDEMVVEGKVEEEEG